MIFYSKCTAAAAWCVNAAVSKATGWPWPLTFWPWKWCASHNYYRKSPFAVFFSLSCALKHPIQNTLHVISTFWYSTVRAIMSYSVVWPTNIVRRNWSKSILRGGQQKTHYLFCWTCRNVDIGDRRGQESEKRVAVRPLRYNNRSTAIFISF